MVGLSGRESPKYILTLPKRRSLAKSLRGAWPKELHRPLRTQTMLPGKSPEAPKNTSQEPLELLNSENHFLDLILTPFAVSHQTGGTRLHVCQNMKVGDGPCHVGWLFPPATVTIALALSGNYKRQAMRIIFSVDVLARRPQIVSRAGCSKKNHDGAAVNLDLVRIWSCWAASGFSNRPGWATSGNTMKI